MIQQVIKIYLYVESVKPLFLLTSHNCAHRIYISLPFRQFARCINNQQIKYIYKQYILTILYTRKISIYLCLISGKKLILRKFHQKVYSLWTQNDVYVHENTNLQVHKCNNYPCIWFCKISVSLKWSLCTITCLLNLQRQIIS